MSTGEQTRLPPPACDGPAPLLAETAIPTEFLSRLAELIATTLDLPTLLRETAELVSGVLPYRIFAIFLMNDRTGDLRMRFQTGHEPETERVRLRVGQGIVGKVAQTRQALLGRLYRGQSAGLLRACRAAHRQGPAHRRHRH